MGAVRDLREDLELLRSLLSVAKAQQDSSSELLSLTRGKLNNMLWSGMALPDASGSWRNTFQVPFSSVSFADPYNLGLSIDTGSGDGRTSGPGLLVTSPGDSGCVPLSGTQLVVTPATTGPFFISVYTRPQPFSYNPDSPGAGWTQGPFVSLPAGSSAVSSGLALDGKTVHSTAIMVIVTSATVTGGKAQAQGSLDGENWYPLVASVASLTASSIYAVESVAANGSITGLSARYLRAAITAPVTGGTIEAWVAFGDSY